MLLYRNTHYTFLTTIFPDRATTKVVKNTEGQNPIEGNDFIIKCDIMAAWPAVTKYRWYMNDSSEPFAETDDDTYTLTDLKHGDDDGEYRCAGRNTPGWGSVGEGMQIQVFCKYTSLN